MDKVNKNFRLSIEMDAADGAIIIEPPLGVQFNIIRNSGAQANSGTFQIYNLAESTRNKIFQDLFDISSQRKVLFEAGYGDNLLPVFAGHLRRAYSRRDGVNVITELYCFDDGQGDMLNSFTNRTVAAGTSIRDIIKGLMGDMRNTITGEVGDFGDTPQQRGSSLIGNTWTILNKYTGGNVYIDLGQVNALKQNETIEGVVLKIDSESGLLGTPQRQDAKLMIDCIFEPAVQVGQIIDIESTIQRQYNGQFKVIGIAHSGLMSESVAGECRTSLELLIPDPITSPVKIVKNGTPTLLPASKNKIYAPSEISQIVDKYCSQYNIEPAFAKAVIKAESGFNPKAVSRLGASGLMQLMPATAKSHGVTDVFNPEQNIKAGVSILAQNLKTYHGNKELVLAAYNAGPGAVAKYGGIPPYKETQNYVKRVMGYYYSYKKV